MRSRPKNTEHDETIVLPKLITSGLSILLDHVRQGNRVCACCFSSSGRIRHSRRLSSTFVFVRLFRHIIYNIRRGPSDLWIR